MKTPTNWKTKAAAWTTGVTGFISWLMTVSPEQQAGILGEVVNMFPVGWRPNIGLVTRAIASASGIYALYRLRNNAQAAAELAAKPAPAVVTLPAQKLKVKSTVVPTKGKRIK